MSYRLRPHLAFIVSVLLGAFARADIVPWILAPPAEGLWNDPANWNHPTVPGSLPRSSPADEARISNGGTALIDSSQTVSVGSVTLGDTTNTSGTIRMTGGSLTTTNTDIKIGGNVTTTGGTGTINQSGGDIIMNAGNLNIGFGDIAVGFYNISGGRF
jgi:hypothetical protein